MYGTPKKQQQQINREKAVGHQMLYNLMLNKVDNDITKGQTTGNWEGGDLFSGVSSATTLGGRFK
jgi:hypothetical protein